MSAIELAQAGLVEDVERLAAAIRQGSAEEASAAYDRLGVAREWAKLQDDAADLAVRLVWLEAVILRRIGELDAVHVLPAARRAAARHFGTLDDAALSSLLEAFPARSAVGAFNLWKRSQGVERQVRRGRDVAIKRLDIDADPDLGYTLKAAIESRIVTVRAAAAVILDEYGQSPTTISAAVDEFIADYDPISPYSSPLEAQGFKRGLAQALRDAFAAAPVPLSGALGCTPAYITTFDEEADAWVRVPSEYATVADARQMLALRRGQLKSAERSLECLEEILEGLLQVADRAPDEYLRSDASALSARAGREDRAS